eukprot:1544082-Rhodomonas_salina.1
MSGSVDLCVCVYGWMYAVFYRDSTAIYGCNAAIYRRNAAIYGCNPDTLTLIAGSEQMNLLCMRFNRGRMAMVRPYPTSLRAFCVLICYLPTRFLCTDMLSAYEPPTP